VPTVVDAATLASDTLDLMIQYMLESAEPDGEPFYRMLSELREEEKYELITQILNEYTGNMFVTPKEVDEVIRRLSAIIANALNISLHKGICKDDINRYMY
jgi:spore protease